MVSAVDFVSDDPTLTGLVCFISCSVIDTRDGVGKIIVKSPY